MAIIEISRTDFNYFNYLNPQKGPVDSNNLFKLKSVVFCLPSPESHRFE